MRISKLTVELENGQEMKFSLQKDGDVNAFSCEVEKDTVLSTYEVEKTRTIAEFILNSKF